MRPLSVEEKSLIRGSLAMSPTCRHPVPATWPSAVSRFLCPGRPIPLPSERRSSPRRTA